MQEQHVAGHQDGVAVHVGDPLPSATHRHDPHAGLNRQLEGRERPVGHVGSVAYQHTVRHLLGIGEVGDELLGDSEAMGDDPGDVHGVIGHALDGGHHLEHRRHSLGLPGTAGGHHAHCSHVMDELAHLLLQLVDLFGHVRVAEVDRRVRQVDHQLGGVLRLGQHGPQVAGSLVHQILARCSG